MKIAVKKIWLACVLLLIGFSCGSKKPTNNQVVTTQDTGVSKTPGPEIDEHYTRLSKLIAGQDTMFNYEHEDWYKDSIKQYAKNVTKKFFQIKSNRLDKMEAWSRKNMASKNLSYSDFCFYPFSGGDFLHVNYMYPEATTYLMVARERVGSLPDLTKENGGMVMEYLHNVDYVLKDIWKKSYFITKEMASDIYHAKVDGMFPMIMWSAARMGHDIIHVKYFDLDTNGTVNYFEKDSSVTKPDGVEVKLVHLSTGKEKTVTYLSADISNKGMAKTPKTMKYLENTVPQACNTFVKSASYLLHYGSFTDIRDIILDRSKVLIQDDTGIPFRKFPSNSWSVNLYGVYEKPVDDFSENLYQADLVYAYDSTDAYKGPLSFSLGYHWGSKNQNQMFIVKK